jgi:hypothetical protein
MVMRSRATDGRSASKCQGKWPDQLLTHRFSTLRKRSAPGFLQNELVKRAVVPVRRSGGSIAQRNARSRVVVTTRSVCR